MVLIVFLQTNNLMSTRRDVSIRNENNEMKNKNNRKINDVILLDFSRTLSGTPRYVNIVIN